MRVFVLTGAGVSAESGLGTFRDADGIWARFDPMKLATPEAFATDPAMVHAFYNLRRRNVIDASPNEAHAAIAKLARHGDLFLCTQNIDDLHERAGSPSVHHMHGELLISRCAFCGARTEQFGDLTTDDPCAACGRLGALRPDVVWFGETPFDLAAIEAAAVQADLFVSIGTSGGVYPAAGLVRLARHHGVRTAEINLEPSQIAGAFDKRRYGPASIEVARFVAGLIG